MKELQIYSELKKKCKRKQDHGDQNKYINK